MLSFKTIKRESGFTLIEVLLSFTLFFIIVIPLMGYFIQAYDYTYQSQNKTVAINIARNIVHYIEKQNYSAMKTYLETEKASYSSKYTILDWNDCGKKVHISSTSSYETPLFYQGNLPTDSICSAVLKPKVNDQIYDEKNISIYLTDYYDNASIPNILTQDLSDTDLNSQLNSTLNGLTPNFEDQLLKVYVVVNWNKKREKIVLEGVISNEALR
ncbi:hypothetical protein M670_01226 [Schinkia azotoformans MEV2011]|uniref:Prepilin-type N-terminal cleavage/methylation domain-containing protein n=1 Tax=Schinkia azotoformans MEV2011 TaxID=1348973 RepID=A0A072NRC7_SCHAZ|nr:prepilin-type N-terminal cleavage/methylation domain-containing protein [Schinkia azotoformans]KEF39458.1 hypothetical protein M670_01226 [Schinkia azotoformans MEV2011]MEC1696842.1 prepilin-type N-terminal cleavage/methylation domain-containing protein [Schinkia azotoformans]MEC1726625.1 prepilin-type N-terminal cleavage/methylation domain-containing protein [Schinkia azotoformans]MEC1780598.1 prepilin-type N-terminal cleavage/methylation domain-containing protein [Schinkia azotoformans]ME